MPINKERADKIGEMAKTMSRKQIAKNLGIKRESVSRYLKHYRHNNDLKPTIKANVLLVDIETLFGVGRFWHVWKENIQPWQIIQPTCILSWAAKWLFEPEVFGDIMTSKEVVSRDSKRIVKTLWDVMERADVVVAHNGRAFDILRMNTEFLLHGLGQPAPYKVIDTCLVARKYFSFEHNTLDNLAERLGLSRKIHTDNDLWVKCNAGNPRALKDMLEYNKMDVQVLEEVYVKLRSWIKDHPNLSLFHSVEEDGGVPRCRTCTSINLELLGEYTTSVNRYNSYRCKDCGAIMRSRRSNTSLIRDTHVLQGIS